jgi:SMI1 / KNR4 family (SUKH-1)
MDEKLSELTRDLAIGVGASDASLRDVADALQVRFPADYLQFMRYSDGGEGPVGSDGYVALWSVAELVGLNKAYQVDEFAPGLVLFGTDGGNTGFAFDRRAVEVRIVSVPLLGMDLSAAEQVATSFAGFLHAVGGGA